MFVRQQYRREYGKGLPHKKPIASETDACKMKSFARLGGLKEAPASIGGEYFTCVLKLILSKCDIIKSQKTHREFYKIFKEISINPVYNSNMTKKH